MSWHELSSEEKIDAAYRVAMEETPPAYVAILRQLAQGMQVEQAFGLWRMARDALYGQEIAKGLPPDEAMRAAARRMLEIDHDSTA